MHLQENRPAAAGCDLLEDALQCEGLGLEHQLLHAPRLGGHRTQVAAFCILLLDPRLLPARCLSQSLKGHLNQSPALACQNPEDFNCIVQARRREAQVGAALA